MLISFIFGFLDMFYSFYLIFFWISGSFFYGLRLDRLDWVFELFDWERLFLLDLDIVLVCSFILLLVWVCL